MLTLMQRKLTPTMQGITMNDLITVCFPLIINFIKKVTIPSENKNENR